MATNIFTKNPVWGDAVVGNLVTGKPEFITSESFDPTALDSNTYETIGAVGGRFGREVLVVWKHNEAQKWCERIECKLTGYTLDGAEHTGVLSIRESSSATASTDFTVTYTASDKAGLVTALNAFFAATAIFTTQKWFARVNDSNGEVYIGCSYEFWQQWSYNTGKAGFALSPEIMPDVTYSSYMLRRNGNGNGEGSIHNLQRAITYFRSDNASTTYNPSKDVTNVKTGYPICLPGYLGTSQYQSDHCAFLRSVYGEGEEGWLRYLKANMVVTPTDFGAMGMRNGKERTAILAAKTFTLADGTPQALCPAAVYAKTSPNSSVISDWFLPTAEHVASILGPVQHGTSANRDADALNKVLWAMGGDAVSNGSYFWSCVRYLGRGAWCADGRTGYFNYLDLCLRPQSLPVSLYRLPEAIL